MEEAAETGSLLRGGWLEVQKRPEMWEAEETGDWRVESGGRKKGEDESEASLLPERSFGGLSRGSQRKKVLWPRQQLERTNVFHYAIHETSRID
jgi:hypothetical protein